MSANPTSAALLDTHVHNEAGLLKLLLDKLNEMENRLHTMEADHGVYPMFRYLAGQGASPKLQVKRTLWSNWDDVVCEQY